MDQNTAEGETWARAIGRKKKIEGSPRENARKFSMKKASGAGKVAGSGAR